MSGHEAVDRSPRAAYEVVARAHPTRRRPWRSQGLEGRPPTAAGEPIAQPRRCESPAPEGPGATERADIAWAMGVTAGCARGLLEGRRRALAVVLAARFGPLEAQAEARVAAVEPSVLDQRLHDAARADDLDAFWRVG